MTITLHSWRSGRSRAGHPSSQWLGLPLHPCLNQALPVSPFLSDMGTGFTGAFRRQKPVMAQRPPAPAWHTEPTPSSTYTARGKAGTTGSTQGGCRAAQELTLLSEGCGTSPGANSQRWHQHRARVRRTHNRAPPGNSSCLGTQSCLFFLQRTRGTNTYRPLLTVTIAGKLKAKSKTISQHRSSKAEAPLAVTAPTILVQAHSTCLAAGHGSCCLLRALTARLADIQCHCYQQLCGDQAPSGASATGLMGLVK